MSDQASPAPTPAADAIKPWAPPSDDQEFVFESLDAAPGWIDKGWAAFDRGPALAVPMIDYPKEGEEARAQPYHTQFAHVGDTIKWDNKKRKFEVVAKAPEEQEETPPADVTTLAAHSSPPADIPSD